MRERYRSTLPQMAERLRCEVCGATNVAGAEWCGQCYTSLGVEVEPPVRPPMPLYIDLTFEHLDVMIDRGIIDAPIVVGVRVLRVGSL